MTDVSQVIPTLKRFGVAYAALFGSQANGTAHAKSDYDFLVEFELGKHYTLLDLAGLQQSLAETLQEPVDVITTRSIHPYIQKNILKNLRVIYDQRNLFSQV